MRTNRYDAGQRHAGTDARPRPTPSSRSAAYWDKEFGEGDPRYGFLKNTVPTRGERQDIADFFFWTAWAAGTTAARPELQLHQQLAVRPHRGQRRLGRGPALEHRLDPGPVRRAGHGGLRRPPLRVLLRRGEGACRPPTGCWNSPSRPANWPAPSSSSWPGCCSSCRFSTAACWPTTPSIRASSTWHFIGEMYPYSWAKTWHLQLAILWIAVSWMGTAVYLAPLVARPRAARPAAAGQYPLRRRRCWWPWAACWAKCWASRAIFGQAAWFWLGHQGWEYLELGRLWQILLFGGLIYWLVVVYRAHGARARCGKTPDDADDRRS